jgi:hypothetical protein
VPEPVEGTPALTDGRFDRRFLSLSKGSDRVPKLSDRVPKLSDCMPKLSDQRF